MATLYLCGHLHVHRDMIPILVRTDKSINPRSYFKGNNIINMSAFPHRTDSLEYIIIHQKQLELVKTWFLFQRFPWAPLEFFNVW